MSRRQMIFRLLALIVAAGALCVRSADRASPATKPATAPTNFTILTYNVEFNHGTPSASVDAIADARADIVCLQESNANWERAIRARLDGDYSEIRFQNPTKDDPGGLAILSKFPIESIQTLAPGERGWFPACIAVVKSPIGRVQILNVHLRPLISDSGSRVKGFFTVELMHKGEMQALARQLDPKLLTLIVGDFNERNDGNATRFLTSQGYVDALPQFDRDTPTWHGEIYGVSTSYRDDHVMLSRDLSCIGARVISRGESDHYPVAATIVSGK